MSKSTESVKVVVRCRPLNTKETQDGRQRIVDMDVREGQVKVLNPKGEHEAPKIFTFDQVYDWNCEQKDIFQITARPIIDSVLEGYNGTIFAYGQTGTGKSHTMEGRHDVPELKGIIPNVFDYIFETIAHHSGNCEYLVRASYLEIYNEDIRDLLSKTPQQKLELKENPDKGVYVKDLMQFVVKSVAEINSVLEVGKKNRSVGSTLMNQDSSRSHSIFTITVETVEHFPGEVQDPNNSHIRVGKLNLVDLAGSERQSKTGATGDRLKEGIKINLSLTALGNVISALVDGKSGHVPYRDSKLTRLLQDSLGGNTKTVMVANIGPADWNYDETLSTLRYANRAKNIQNKPKVNEDPKDAMLREFQEEIARLQAQLAAKKTGGAAHVPAKVVEKVVEDVALMERLKDQMRAEVEAKMKESWSSEALQKAKEEAEHNARQQLEVLLAESNKTEEERKRLRHALKQQCQAMDSIVQQMEEEKKEKEQLENRLKAMQDKVLHGGVNLLEKVDELKKRSENTKAMLEVQRRQEEEQSRRIKELEDKTGNFDKRYNSLEEEVTEKTWKLRKLYEQYKAKSAELKDLEEQFQSEREDLLQDYRILTQSIKLKNLIIACFIPPSYQDIIMKHCHWQEYDEIWSIDYVTFAGNAVRLQQEMSQAREEKKTKRVGSSVAHADNEKLKNIYFSYDNLQNELDAAVGIRPPSGTKSRPRTGSARPSTGGSPVRSPSARKKDASKGSSLRDSVQWGSMDPDEVRQKQLQAAFPQARGLIKDTADKQRRTTRQA